MADLSKDTLLFAKEFRRMCKAHPGCIGCPLDGTPHCDSNNNIIPELIEVVQVWSDEHPPKTYAQDFREKFPNCAWREDENRPVVCRSIIYRSDDLLCRRTWKCAECWNEPMPEE